LLLAEREACEQHTNKWTNLAGKEGTVEQLWVLVTTSEAMLLELDFARFLREYARDAAPRADADKNVMESIKIRE
jgi:hypothetical protein